MPLPAKARLPVQKQGLLVQHALPPIGLESQGIAAGNSDLSSRTEQQASSLPQTASRMEQMTGSVVQNAENARQAIELSQQAADMAGMLTASIEASCAQASSPTTSRELLAHADDGSVQGEDSRS